ncbi:MAG: glutamine-synthetase adenylyltransferase [Pseudomonadota bacterium]
MTPPAITCWPAPFEPDRAAEVAPLYDAGPLRDLAGGAAGCSPYLHGILRAEADWITAAMAAPEAALDALLGDAAPGAMRRDKQRMAALVALLDLGGAWDLAQVTAALTDFADRAVARAIDAELAPLQARGKLPGETGLFVLAMGKMGAHELNYSSDIDLICMMDDHSLDAAEAGTRRGLLIRAVRAAMRRLSDVTEAGYVFRTDLRLRPDASVTPVVVTTRFAETYYEGLGRTWERAAFIKARAAAGDIPAGARFLEALRPFVWRRHLDFAAIEDAHDILRKIRAHHGLAGPITLPGHDMKLGRGGIREIEFFAQTRQLISGGRDGRLRHRSTLDALAALAEAGWVESDVSGTLAAAYTRHREVEHRLQMLRDAQTHALPQSAEGFDRLAAFMGTTRAALEARLRDDLEAVHALCEPFFAPRPVTREEGAETPDFGTEITRRWLSYPALRSPRAARLFERLKPRILHRLGDAREPERALGHFDAFLAGLPAGVQVFSLFEANPQLVDLLTDIVTTAPRLAEYLGRNAGVFDAVIGGTFFEPWPGAAGLVAALNHRLAREGDYEARLDAARAWSKEMRFRIGVHHLRGLVDAEEAGRQYADLAEAVLAGLWPVVTREFARKHGPEPGQGAAVVAMGSLGAGRLHAASDLDLILIYDAGAAEASDGPRPLPVRSYFARLTQALITALSAPMAQGRLYEVDMRLRPSGRNGPVAVSVASWESYQQSEAWTWEHLALTRARAVAGSVPLGARIEAFRCALLAQPRDASEIVKIKADVADMRARIFAARPGAGGLTAKDGPGRLQDLELFAQSQALLSGRDARDVAGQLSDVADAADLLAHGRQLWQVRAGAALIGLTEAHGQGVGQAAMAFILRITGQESEAALVAALEDGAATTVARIEAALAGAEAAPS